MKILLDESVPQKLRLLIDRSHAISTTAFQKWSGLKNGALLTTAEESGFDLFVTADQELTYQQNFAERKLALISSARITGVSSRSTSERSQQPFKLRNQRASNSSTSATHAAEIYGVTIRA